MTGDGTRPPDPVAAAAENLAAAIAQMVVVSVAAALAGHQCAGNEPGKVQPSLLTYKQACQRLGISLSKLYLLLGEGAIQNVALGPKVRRIHVAELDRYVATLCP